jgi:TolA-binding protein
MTALPRRTPAFLWAAALAAVFVITALAPNADAARKRRKTVDPAAKLEYKANDMIDKGLEFLEMKQEERGMKLISSVPQMFPQSKARFRAHLELGKYHVEKRRYELAVKQFQRLSESETPDEIAEGLYRTGICYYHINNFDRAFTALRKVTAEYPWSVYANEAYFYIGQCHFKLNRWAKAVEALKMVGTSVPTTAGRDAIAEAGQRLYVKILDKDLVVLMRSGQKLNVQAVTGTGDHEALMLEPLGRTGETFIGSVNTAPGAPVKDDGILQFVGGETVTVQYVDENTAAGKRHVKVLSEVRLVSTGSIGFTDGAYREYTKGVFSDNDCFIRVKDMDRDVSDQQDQVEVRVFTRYRVEKPADVTRDGIDLDEDEEEELRERDSVRIRLRETGPHTGIFVGTGLPKLVAPGVAVNPADDALFAEQNDDIVVAYTDDYHLAGDGPRDIEYAARILTGQIQDVKVEHREVNTLELKARKELIEGKIFLKLATIFKEVGLTKNAREKAEEGLVRAEDVIRMSIKSSLDRSIVEEAFNIKWDLLLVQDKLAEAIAVCNALTRLFPDSTLVDKALMKIGMAKMQSEDRREIEDAVRIFNSVLRLRASDLKPEAQFRIAEVLEMRAEAQARGSGRKPDLSHAMLAYKKCAEQFPESSFAGDSLEKIVNFYINARDYRRAIELMERVFQDYPDANFLDKMLLKWVIAAYRMKDYATAKEKLDQLLTEYPNSPYAEKARKFQSVIDKKLAAAAKTAAQP